VTSQESTSATPAPGPRAALRVRDVDIFVAIVLFATIVLRVATLVPEVRFPGGMLNDMVLHDATIRAASRAMARGDSPLDSWLGSVSVGYPFLRQYQPVAHVLAASIHRGLGEAVDASSIRAWLTALALVAFPLAVYRAARDLGLGRVGAAVAAAVSPLLEAPLLLGLTDQAYLWRGFGLYTQALGAIPFVLSIGRATRAIETGRGIVVAGLLLGATLLTHFIFGWLAAMIIGAIALVATPGPIVARAGRLGFVMVIAAAASAFILLPAVETGAYANHSTIEPQEKWDGYNPSQIWAWTVEGRMLDGDAGEKRALRLPVISALVGVGLFLALMRAWPLAPSLGVGRFIPGAFAARVAVMLALSAFLLAGRTTEVTGWVVDHLPGAKYLHLQRMIGGIHLAAILLAGLVAHALASGLTLLATPRASGDATLEPAAPNRPGLEVLGLTGILFAVALFPAVLERIEFCRVSGESAANADQGANEPELRFLLDRAVECAPGRTYAGHGRAEPYVTKLAQGVPLDGVTTANDIETLGHLWHPYAIASDVAYFRFRPEESIDAETFGVTRFLIPESAPAPPFARRIDAAKGIVLYERPDNGWFALVSAPRRISVSPLKAYAEAERWFGSLERKLGVAPLFALDGEAWEIAGAEDRPPAGAIVETSAVDDTFAANVEMEEAGYLCARIAYHPSLGATVDGVAAPVACVMPGFAAVRVAPGRHEVLIFVAPHRGRVWIFLGGVLLVCAAAWALRRPGLARVLGPGVRPVASAPATATESSAAT